MIAIIGVPVVENSLTFVDDQKFGSNDVILLKVLFMLKKDVFHFRTFVSNAF